MLLKLLKRYNRFSFFKNQIIQDKTNQFLSQVTLLPRYYLRNDQLWQEGLMFDFLQKKVLDKWIRKFLIHSANLFSERFVFDKLIRVYIESILNPGQLFSPTEFNNVSSLFTLTFLPLLVIFLLILLFYFVIQLGIIF